MLAAILTTVSMLIASALTDTLDVARISAHVKAETASSSPVQRLTDDELRRAGSVYLNEAVRSLSGVSVKDYGGIGGLKTVSIRNMGSAHTSISYDGITISDAQNGQVDIGRFFLDDIKEISLAIGQEDNIFRSARSASSSGTLHIRSKSPSFAEGRCTNLSAGVTIGSFNTYNPKIRYEQKFGDLWSLSANGSWLISKGDYPFTLENGSITTKETRLGSDVSIINGEINLYGCLRTGGSITAKANIHNSERGLPGSVVLYSQNPTERLWNRNIMLSARYEETISQNWKAEAALTYTNAWNRYTDTSPLYAKPQDNRYTQQELSTSGIIQYSPSAGIRISLAEDLFGNMLDANTPECPFPRRLSSLTALSAQYIGNNLKATVSLLGTYICEHTLTEEAAAPNRARISPSASISYALLKNSMRIRASFRDGFRVPTFNDLYYARVGNTSLMPEKAQQFNIGITWNKSSERLDIGVTADGYLNNITDKIVATPTMFIWKMRNVGKVRMLGTDLSITMKWQATENVRIHTRANLSYQYAVDITDPSSKNWKHQIPYTPRHTGNATISAETRWITATYSLNAVGRRYTLGQNIPANLIEGYCDHSASLNRTFTFRGIRIHISLEALNLGGINYEIIRYYPMPGRNYRLTLKISY